MVVQILTVCGAGIGTSEILRVTAQRALLRLGIDAQVTATDADHVHELGEDVQVILATSEKVAGIGRTFAQVIVIDNILDLAEVEAKLADALE
ncbi:PTS sugar transporter subunit IIB [uncultured Amnibacterium sp.]|uniref:PTS sugar transporter subunit IIB n=1 Tax=uncultured Amnibacterium sp. TaxID=1631851 RepID=UPI0035CC9D63